MCRPGPPPQPRRAGVASAESRRIAASAVVPGILLAAISCPAEERPPLSSERPSFSYSPTALDRGAWQVELGYQHTRDDDGADFEDDTLPQLLLRYGVTDGLELQLGWAGYSDRRIDGVTVDGSNDVSVALKLELTGAGALVPVAFYAGWSLPVGDSDIGADEGEPTVGILWSHDGPVDLFGTLAVTESDDDRLVGNGVGISLPIDERFGGYVEYVALFPEGSGPAHVLNGGVTMLRTPDQQVDVNVGIGLNERATDMTFGLGFVQRF